METPDNPHVAVVTGSTSGLGFAIAMALCHAGWIVRGWSHHEDGGLDHENYSHTKVDLRWNDEIMDAAKELASEHDHIDALINCAGINHLCPLPELSGDMWEAVMDTNAKALVMTTMALLPKLAFPSDPMYGGTVLNIVSNAAHVPMTHSCAYNASKGAALMVSKQMARELFKSHGVTVFSLSPNKLAGTAMSRQIEAAVPALRGWTPEQAADYQRNALPTGMETDPIIVAEFIAFLLSKKERHIYLHSCDIPYGG